MLKFGISLKPQKQTNKEVLYSAYKKEDKILKVSQMTSY